MFGVRYSIFSMWICPTCKRSFKRKDQQHSCVLISRKSLFAKRPAELKVLFHKIEDEVRKLGDYKEETVPPDVIFFKNSSTFLAVKVKKNHLEVEFFLDHHAEAPVISKWLQTSKNRFAHVVPVDDANDISKQLLDWIGFSYKLVRV